MMKKAALLGHPISHSLSPKLHGYWLDKYGIEGSYEAIDTPPEMLENRLKSLANEGYSGVNLTVPLKEVALAYCDELSLFAKHTSAVNIVKFEHGKLIGDNSDAYGFIENLRQAQGDITPYLEHAVVLGAGGAARAVVVGLVQAGVKRITLLNRTIHKAQNLAPIDARISVGEWQQRDEVLADASLLVNTTSLGMVRQSPLEISLSQLPVNALVTDIVYTPLMTDLLTRAKQRGNLIIDGLGMLLHQAVPAFESFYGIRPEVTSELRQSIQI